MEPEPEEPAPTKEPGPEMDVGESSEEPVTLAFHHWVQGAGEDVGGAFREHLLRICFAWWRMKTRRAVRMKTRGCTVRDWRPTLALGAGGPGGSGPTEDTPLRALVRRCLREGLRRTAESAPPGEYVPRRTAASAPPGFFEVPHDARADPYPGEDYVPYRGASPSTLPDGVPQDAWAYDPGEYAPHRTAESAPGPPPKPIATQQRDMFMLATFTPISDGRWFFKTPTLGPIVMSVDRILAFIEWRYIRFLEDMQAPCLQ